MTDLPDDPEIARLRVLAEDPLVRPSVRVAARKALRDYRRTIEAAETATAARRRLAAKIRRGEPMSWRETATAREIGLMQDEDAAG